MKERKKQRLEEKQDKKKQRAQLGLLVDEQQMEFNPNLEDERFPEVYKNPAFAIDPADPNFNHRRTGKIFAEAVKKNKSKHR